MATEQRTGARGRPGVPDIDASVLEAARSRLVDNRFAKTTVQAIADSYRLTPL